MKIVKGLAVWLLSVGMAYLVGDIAFGSDISEYVTASGQAAVYIVGGLIIAAVYSCWFSLRKEQRLADIAVPACVLVAWALARRKLLYDGGSGLIYSIAWEIRKAYGIRSVHADLDYANVNAMYELVLYVTAVAMFFAAYLIFRCSSLMLAIALSLLFVSAGAALSVNVSPQGIIFTVVSLMTLRYILVHEGQKIAPFRDVAVPLAAFALCLIISAGVYNAAYEKGVKSQGRLLSAVDSLEIFLTGGNGKGYSSYYKVDGSSVHPTDDVIDEIIRDEKPVGNLYVTVRSYVTYDDGLWRNRDIGYSAENGEFLEYDSVTFAGLESDITEIAGGRTGFSHEITDDVVSYIREHMSYTTTPGGFDDSEDPVMYALYTAHKGYCVHFASAAAIALRCAHIPSRYSTGYVVPSAAWELQEDGTYKADILDKYSHAWAEAYDADKESWTIVDATPLSDRADQLGIPDEPENTEGRNSNTDIEDGNSEQQAGTSENASTETASETESEVSTEATSEASSEAGSEVSSDTGSDVTSEVGSEASSDTGSEASGGAINNAADAAGESSNETSGGTDSSVGENGSGEADGEAENTAGNGGAESASGFGGTLSGVLPAICGVIFTLVICMAVIVIRRRTLVVRRRRSFASRNRIAAIHDISSAVNDMLEYAKVLDRNAQLADDNEYAGEVPRVCDIINEQDFADFVACVQAAVYGGVQPDDEQMKAAKDIYDKVRAYCYWSLGGAGRLRWKYVRCFD